MEEQREELLLVSWSSVVTPVGGGLCLTLRPSLSVLLELWMEQTSWRSLTSHRDPSWGVVGLSDKRGRFIEESRRRHRRSRESYVQLGLMAQESSSSQSSSWMKRERSNVSNNKEDR